MSRVPEEPAVLAGKCTVGDPERDIAVVRAIYDAMAASDIEAILRLVDERVVVTQDLALPWGGRFEGHDGLGRFAMALRGAIDSRVRIDAVFVGDGDVFVSGRTIGSVLANGASFDTPIVHRWTVRDGRGVAAHDAIDTPTMLQALG